MASSSLRPGSTATVISKYDGAGQAALEPEHAAFGVAYDDEDRNAAATSMQSRWRGHSMRRKTIAAQLVQRVARGRLARRNVPNLKEQQEVRHAAEQQLQRQKHSREHRLQRLELEMKMMESVDTNAYVKYMVHRQNRMVIKIQKRWRMKMNKRKMLKGRGMDIEITPQLEKAVRKIQDIVRRTQIRWKQPIYPPPDELNNQLNLRIKAKLKQPLRHAEWENNPEYLETEATRKFWQYRSKRSDQQTSVWRRKVMRRDMDKMISQIELTSELLNLTNSTSTVELNAEQPNVAELEKKGLLRSSQYRQATNHLLKLHRTVSDGLATGLETKHEY